MSLEPNPENPMKLLLLAVAALVLPALQDDLEPKRKRMGEILVELTAMKKKTQADPGLRGDPEFAAKAQALIKEGDEIIKLLTGGVKSREDEVMLEVSKKYAPELHAEMLAARIPANESAAVACLRNLCTAQADFRANDRDNNRVNDFWAGDVAGLCNLVPVTSDQKLPAKEDSKRENTIRLIEDDLADADAAPIKLPASGRAGPEKPQPKSGYLFVALKKYETADGPKDYGSDTDGEESPYGAVHNLDQFAFAAYPAEPGKSGKLTFLVTQDALIWKKDTGGKAPETCPADPVKAGWEKAR